MRLECPLKYKVRVGNPVQSVIVYTRSILHNVFCNLVIYVPGGPGGSRGGGPRRLGGRPGGGPGGIPGGRPGGGPGGNIRGGAPGGPPRSGGGRIIIGGKPGGGPVRQ